MGRMGPERFDDYSMKRGGGQLNISILVLFRQVGLFFAVGPNWGGPKQKAVWNKLLHHSRTHPSLKGQTALLLACVQGRPFDHNIQAHVWCVQAEGNLMAVLLLLDDEKLSYSCFLNIRVAL